MDAPFPSGLVDEIEKFFREVHPRLEPGKDVYDEVFDMPLFFPLQRRNEMRKMMKIARSIQPTTVFEIGADKGGGLYHWCMCLPTVKQVIACEIRGLPYDQLFEKAFRRRIDFLWLPYSSYAPFTVSTVKSWLDLNTPKVARHTPIDCLFIDGDKGAFLKDFDAYEPMMSDKGIVFLHDINDPPEPGQAVAPTKAAFDTLYGRGYEAKAILDISESIAACERAKQGIEPANVHESWLRHWKGASCGVGVVYPRSMRKV